MFPILRLLLRISLVSALVSTLRGEDEEAWDPVDCRLLWFDHRVAPPVLWHAAEGGEELRLEMPGRGTLGPEIRCHSAGGVMAFRVGDSERTIKARVPNGTDEAILIFLPVGGGDGPPRQRIFAVDGSEENFPPGGAVVANFYHREIRFALGEHRIRLRPGGSHGAERPEELDAFNMAPLLVQFRQGEGWRTASESQVRSVPGMRYLILAYVDPGSGRPRIATFTLVEPVAEPGDE